jgi:hypothetical protein
MISYIPAVYCAKCGKRVADVMRLHTKNERFVRVRCHGAVQHIGFADNPDEQVTLWEGAPNSPPSQGSN